MLCSNLTRQYTGQRWLSLEMLLGTYIDTLRSSVRKINLHGRPNSVGSQHHLGNSQLYKKFWIPIPMQISKRNKNKKIPQSGICPAPCMLRQCTVVFAWKCRLFYSCAYGQCRVYYIYHVEFHFRFRVLESFRFNISRSVVVTVRSHQKHFR